MIELNNDSNRPFKDNPTLQEAPTINYWQGNSYSPLLNHQALTKSLKRNVWKYGLRDMLRGFMGNIDKFQGELKFKVSGKILDSSTYVLKTKTNTIINHSLEAQEDIKEAQTPDITEEDMVSEIEPDFIDDYDDEAELFEAFSTLEAEGLLTEEQKRCFEAEKVNRALELDASELNNRLKDKINLIYTSPKVAYKRIELEDVAEKLGDMLKSDYNQVPKELKKEKKKIDKSKLPFLPEGFIENAEKKRADFENRIDGFMEILNAKYSGEPLPFLGLIPKASIKSLVDTLLIILHLINQKKIELWEPFNEDNAQMQEAQSENSGQNVYISPL